MASASSSDSGTLYTVPAVQRPTIEQLRSVAEALHLHISADELNDYKCRPILITFNFHAIHCSCTRCSLSYDV